MFALIEWRTGIFHDLVKLRNWNPFQRQRGTQNNKNDD